MSTLKTLKQLHELLESDFKINKRGYNFNNIINRVRNNYKKELIKKKCDWEQWFLDFILVEGIVKPTHVNTDEKGNTFEYPSFNSFTKETYEYLEEKLKNIENPHLKAYYYHILTGSGISKYRHQNYSKNAIDAYLEILKNKTEKEFSYISFIVFQNALYLSYKIDYNVEKIEAELISIINENLISNGLFKRLIEILLKFQPSKSSSFIKILNISLTKCNEIINNFKIEDKHSAIDFLNTKINISNRLGIDSKKSLIQKGIFWEELAGQRNDFMSNDFQYEAIKCYNKAGEKEFKESAIIKYTQYKRRLVLHNVNSEFSDEKLDELIDVFEKNATIISEKDSDYIYTFLSLSDDILFNFDSNVKKEQKSFMDFSKPVTFDINNNISYNSSKSFSFNISSEFQRFFSLIYIKLIFEKGINSGRISYETFINFLKSKSWFGQPLPAKDLDGNSYNYNWIGLLAPSILDFFFQYPYTLKDKSHQVNYLLCIDSLSLKFEGVLRDIAFFNRIQTDIYDEKNERMRERYIEELLNDVKMIELLGKNDIEFLKYIFTKEGLNLRNNIAHCYLNFSNYSADKFLLLLIAFLRLSKFKINFEKQI